MVEESDATDGELQAFLKPFEETGILRANSMDVSNDPRFYTDNVLNYRLTAFGSVAIVSGLMVQNAMDHVFEMNKQMLPRDEVGIFQLISFFLMVVVLCLSLVATYIGVAQPYHTIRLMTAGPTGFECAASYYLNKSIVFFRHMGVKAMLLSLPLFALAQGPRIYNKFYRGNMVEPDLPDQTPLLSGLQGWIFGGFLMLFAVFLTWMHWKHFAVFRDRYKVLSSNLNPEGFKKYKRDLMRTHNADVDV
mmetsp:Transcript_60341/g.143767  ORF Transcript_60341/g.143767 Transcript_60341/m.143767 type:complete len:248 (-) Transcript_60341:300-1043(-)|eukprot:CAMPEP_0178417036 /NCGR_PEP_ID=MMETSP0689_2-20121128/24371_1 /TAXON_ID=160604 /ORGANISM="Amphidinium massartii, Strain CS-259" /LENGTH=247 /DNA_ID=CAMNT_0020038397 /DNA_START=83 /DNA_END=826 /DNA_ORIENTATION=+